MQIALSLNMFENGTRSTSSISLTLVKETKFGTHAALLVYAR